MINFTLPHENEAHVPPEERGISRDQVRLLVSYRSKPDIVHSQFNRIGDYLLPGDVLVINTSKTINASLLAALPDGKEIQLRVSTMLPADMWIVELYLPKTEPQLILPEIIDGEILSLPGNASATLLKPYKRESRYSPRSELWVATFSVGGRESVFEYLEQFGIPIFFSHHLQPWPLSCFQTVYALEPGSAEMPSAGRPFTCELITSLIARGVQITPLVLHSGTNSEGHIPPHEEFYRVPSATAQLINAAHAEGRRVIAVGSTVVRALETVTDDGCRIHPGTGWTRVIVRENDPIKSVNGLITGFHEPGASHIDMVVAFSGLESVSAVYRESLDRGYLWHEFGDVNLILP
jgi:S-adenosylmethionine:tRNA ribosyltransferase-isomerase